MEPLYVVDELIRQVTINCAERGLLLLRVRDEIRMTIAAYQTLYESSVAFGMRKALQAEQGKADMERKVVSLDTTTSNCPSMTNYYDLYVPMFCTAIVSNSYGWIELNASWQKQTGTRCYSKKKRIREIFSQ